MYLICNATQGSHYFHKCCIQSPRNVCFPSPCNVGPMLGWTAHNLKKICTLKCNQPPCGAKGQWWWQNSAGGGFLAIPGEGPDSRVFARVSAGPAVAAAAAPCRRRRRARTFRTSTHTIIVVPVLTIFCSYCESFCCPLQCEIVLEIHL